MDRSFLALVRSIFFSTLLLGLSSLCANSAFAYIDDEEEMIGYDVIINELTNQSQNQNTAASKSRAKNTTTDDPFANVWMHFGAGYIGTAQTLTLPSGKSMPIDHNGVQASLGIDLFSEHWMAEGTARSFADEQNRLNKIRLKEFELKLFYKNRIAPSMGFRAGGGLAARYMTIQQNGRTIADLSTPSSVGTLGIDMFLSKSFSFGVDLSARNTMISDTFDKRSYDATLRMDSHF